MRNVAEENLSKKDIIDLWFKKYSLLKAEVHIQINSFKNHVRNVQIILPLLLSGAAYLIFDDRYVLTNENVAVWLVGLFLAVNLTFYLVYDNIDPLYQITVIAERMRSLELKINDAAESNVLIWESKLSQKLNDSWKPFPKVRHPLWLVQFYIAVLLIVAVIIAPTYVCIKAWNLTPNDIWIKGAIIFVLTYSIGSILMLLYTARGLVYKLRPESRDAVERAVAEKWHKS